MAKIRTMADIEAFERAPLAERHLPTSTYEALQRGAAKNPGKTALYFFPRGENYEHSGEITFEREKDLLECEVLRQTLAEHLAGCAHKVLAARDTRL
jgi:hypothetical protein